MARRVQAGEDIAIPARTWNRLVASLEDGPSRHNSFIRRVAQQTRCVIRNDTFTDLPKYSAVALGEPVADPDINEEAFLERIVLIAPSLSTTPYQWAITQEDIPAGEYGEAAVSGLTYTKINVLTDMFISQIKFAAPSGSPSYLLPTSCGIGRVVWLKKNPSGNDQVISSEAGNRWAIINIG